jgi:hypothetical protein
LLASNDLQTATMQTALNTFLRQTYPERERRVVGTLHKLARALCPSTPQRERASLLSDARVRYTAYRVHRRLMRPRRPLPAVAGAGAEASSAAAGGRQAAAGSGASLDGQDDRRQLASLMKRWAEWSGCRDGRTPLEFWSDEMKHQASLLARVALAVPSIPAATAPLERAFSGLSHIFGPQRQRMSVAGASARLVLRATRTHAAGLSGADAGSTTPPDEVEADYVTCDDGSGDGEDCESDGGLAGDGRGVEEVTKRVGQKRPPPRRVPQASAQRARSTAKRQRGSQADSARRGDPKGRR